MQIRMMLVAALITVLAAAAAARADGAAAWGYNGYGELGNGTTTSSTVPVAVSGLTSGVTALAGGYEYSLAIQNGAAYAWGWNVNGQLGNGTVGPQSGPGSTVLVAVSGLSSGVTAVACGLFHGLAIQNGTAYAWGDNAEGELGNGVSGHGAFSAVPVPVSGLSSGVTAVAGGGHHSLAVQNGAAYAWGWNGNGQLGNGTTADSHVPVAVSGLSSGVTAIACGDYHSLAIKNGQVYAWGSNVYGELGDGTTNSHYAPELVSGLSNIVQIAASDESSYALAANGTLYAWGYNEFGDLGTGDDATRYTPTAILPPAGCIFTGIGTGCASLSAVATIARRLPGDINGDGLVDVADYDIWAAHVGMTGATWSQGDLNGDGLVDVADYDIWAANVGATASTPQPATLSLLAIGGVALLRRRAATAG